MKYMKFVAATAAVLCSLGRVLAVQAAGGPQGRNGYGRCCKADCQMGCFDQRERQGACSKGPSNGCQLGAGDLSRTMWVGKGVKGEAEGIQDGIGPSRDGSCKQLRT